MVDDSRSQKMLLLLLLGDTDERSHAGSSSLNYFR